MSRYSGTALSSPRKDFSHKISLAARKREESVESSSGSTSKRGSRTRCKIPESRSETCSEPASSSRGVIYNYFSVISGNGQGKAPTTTASSETLAVSESQAGNRKQPCIVKFYTFTNSARRKKKSKTLHPLDLQTSSGTGFQSPARPVQQNQENPTLEQLPTAESSGFVGKRIQSLSAPLPSQRPRTENALLPHVSTEEPASTSPVSSQRGHASGVEKDDRQNHNLSETGKTKDHQASASNDPQPGSSIQKINTRQTLRGGRNMTVAQTSGSVSTGRRRGRGKNNVSLPQSSNPQINVMNATDMGKLSVVSWRVFDDVALHVESSLGHIFTIPITALEEQLELAKEKVFVHQKNVLGVLKAMEKKRTYRNEYALPNTMIKVRILFQVRCADSDTTNQLYRIYCVLYSMMEHEEIHDGAKEFERHIFSLQRQL